MSYVTAFIGTHIICIYLIEKGLYLDFRWNQLSAVIYSLACYLLLKYLIFLQLKESFFLIFFWAFYELQYLLNVSIFLKKIHIIFYSIIYLQQSWSLKLYKSFLLSEDKCYNPIFFKKLQH